MTAGKKEANIRNADGEETASFVISSNQDIARSALRDRGDDGYNPSSR